MSLRENCNPFRDASEVRDLFGKIYAIAREWSHVASIAGSCTLHGVGNDLDIVLVPFWNGPADPYPVRLDLETRLGMLRQMAEAVGGETPLFNGDILLQFRQYNDVICFQIWLPENRVIDVKLYPGEYVREDIREAVGHQSVNREDAHSVYVDITLFSGDGSGPDSPTITGLDPLPIGDGHGPD